VHARRFTVTDSDSAKEVSAVIDAITDALNAGDVGKLDSLLSHEPGSTHIGTDAKEWWTSQELVAGISEAMSVGGSQIRADHDEPSVHVRGDVAWVEGRGKFTNGTGAERATRMTGVFVREGGQWKAVQIHASIGVPNEDIFAS
jgi:ketosteroid isomerase-like protein